MSDIFSNVLNSASNAVHDLGKSTIGKMAETAVAAYFMGPAGLDLGAEGGALEGISTAGLGGLAGGAVTLLNGGNIGQAVTNGMLAYGVGSLMGSPTTSSSTPSMVEPDTNTIPGSGASTPSNPYMSPTPTAPAPVINPEATPNYGPDPYGPPPSYTGQGFPAAQTPVQAATPTAVSQAITPVDPAVAAAQRLGTPGSGGALDIGFGPGNMSPQGTTGGGVWNTIKNAYTNASPYQVAGAGALGLMALKSAAKPNSVSPAKIPTQYINRYNYNPYSQQMTLAARIPACQFSAATGGIVALNQGGPAYQGYAHGGIARRFDAGGSTDPNINATYTPQQISDYIAQNNLSGDALTAAENQFGVTQQQVNYANALNSPLAASDPFAATVASADTANNIPVSVGVQNEAATGSPYTSYTGQQMGNYIQQTGLNTSDPAALAAAEAATHADPAAVQAYLASINNPYSAQSLANPAAANVSSFDAQLGTKGATTDINNAVYAAQLAAGVPGGTSNSTVANTQIAKEMDTWGVDPAAMGAAVGMTTAQIQALYNQVNPNGRYSTVQQNNGGGTTINPNGTVTESPVEPGIPAGGWTGMANLKNEYTARGGSLGYTNAAPTSMDQFNQEFNTMTGGSAAAYNFLMGNTTQPKTPYTPTGQVAIPYATAVMGSKAYIKDPNTGNYVLGQVGAKDSKGNPIIGSNGVPVNATYDPATGYYIDATGNMYTNQGVNISSGSSGSSGSSTANTSNSSKVGTSINVNGGKAVYDPISSLYVLNGQYYNADGSPNSYVANANAKAGGLMALAHGGRIRGYAGDAGSLVNNASEAYENSNLNEAGAYQNDPLEAFYKTVPSSVMRTPTGAGLAAALYSPALNVGDQQQMDAIRQQMHSPTSQYVNGRMRHTMGMAAGGMSVGHLGGYSDGGRLLRGPGDGVSDSIPATIGSNNPEPARLADGEFVVPARIVSELGNGSTEAGARQLYKMMDRIQAARSRTVGKDRVATDTNAAKYLPV